MEYKAIDAFYLAVLALVLACIDFLVLLSLLMEAK